MNIFVTHPNPYKCAKHLDDKRVVKMVLETAQLLSTVLYTYGVRDERLYRPTHKNHPCTKWATQTRGNYLWLLNHFKGLCAEYTARYDKTHASEKRLLALFNAHIEATPEGKLTPFANCAANNTLGLDFKHFSCVYIAYMEYLNARWETDKRPPTWYGQQ